MIVGDTTITQGVILMIDTSKKTRINLTISYELKAQIEQLAKEDMRSTNSMIIKMLRENLEARENKEN